MFFITIMLYQLIESESIDQSKYKYWLLQTGGHHLKRSELCQQIPRKIKNLVHESLHVTGTPSASV